jgi:hypothetical protein
VDALKRSADRFLDSHARFADWRTEFVAIAPDIREAVRAESQTLDGHAPKPARSHRRAVGAASMAAPHGGFADLWRLPRLPHGAGCGNPWRPVVPPDLAKPAPGGASASCPNCWSAATSAIRRKLRANG